MKIKFHFSEKFLLFGILSSNFDVGVTIYFEDKNLYQIPLNSINFHLQKS